jgi:hypothetical protein
MAEVTERDSIVNAISRFFVNMCYLYVCTARLLAQATMAVTP